MRRDDWLAAPFIRPALGALAVAVASLGWSVSHFVGAGAVPDDAAPRTALRTPGGTLASGHPVRGESLDAAPLDDDPFSPERSAPERPYALPGEEAESPAAAALAPPPPSPRPTLLGTAVVAEGGGFATARLGDGAPKIVHIGERLGPYTLRAVARGRATFAGVDGEAFDVRASEPSASR